MKKTLNFARFFIFAVTIGLCIHYCDKKLNTIPIKAQLTQIKIYNATQDSVLVYVTLGATTGCLQKVNAIPFITDTVPGQLGMQGTFKLAPNDSTVAYAPDSLGYNGVISFNFAPDNCSSISYPNGINQFEFMINNLFQGPSAQESINISCVHGVNCVIRVNTQTLNSFNAGPTMLKIQGFANTLNKNQTGIPGVYPYGCDTCTGSKNPPACIPLPQPSQKQSICQVQRNAMGFGGLIKVIYEGFDQPLK
jgi:hypothetical protein